MELKEALQFLERKKKLVILFFILSVIGSTIYFFRISDSYTAEVLFYISGNDAKTEPVTGTDAIINVNSLFQTSELVFHLAESSEITDYLIHRFNLYERYGIDTSDVFAYEKITSALRDNIRVTRKDPNVLSVSFNDGNRYFSAEAANEIVRRMNVMLRKHMVDNIMMRAKIYEMVMDDIRQQSNLYAKNLDSTILRFHDLLRLIKVRDLKDVELRDAEYSLNNIGAASESVAFELLRSKKIHSWVLHVIEESALPSLVVLQNATPDFRGRLLQKIKLSVVTSISLFIVLTSLLILTEYSKRTLFSNGVSVSRQESQHTSANLYQEQNVQ